MDKEPVNKHELLELYKFHAELYDRSDQRQHSINRLHIGLLTLVLTTSVAFVGLALRFPPANPLWGITAWGVGFIAGMTGVLLSVSWWIQILAHSKSMAAKLAVLKKLEERISFDFFSCEERELQQQGKKLILIVSNPFAKGTLSKKPIFAFKIRYTESILPAIFFSLSFAIYVTCFVGGLVEIVNALIGNNAAN